MALTKPRAYQIYDIDYKQATRAVTVANVTLTAGAPNNVDGVNLSVNDRVLVTGQTTQAQNGVYVVSVLGTGANGTWTRSGDTDVTGELLAGTIIMVTEGAIYADTQWKLITDNPIVIGTTALIFTQNYYANVLHAGNSNVTVYSNADITVTSAGTANVLTVSNTGIAVLGTVSSTGNITANVGSFFIGNGSQLTGIDPTIINNGTSNVVVPVANGNINVNVAGNAIAEFTPTGLIPAGNIVMDLGNSTNYWRDLYLSGNTIYLGNALISANTTSIILTTPDGGNTILSGDAGNAEVTGATVSVTGDITSGNLVTSGDVTASGNVISNNVSVLNAGVISTGGNVLGNNIIVGGTISAVGNITANIGSFFIGNGSQLVGIIAGNSNAVVNGNSNISIPVANGSILFAVGGAANTLVIDPGSLTMYGSFATPKIIASNVTISPNVNAILYGPLNVTEGVGITVPTSSTLYIYGSA